VRRTRAGTRGRRGGVAVAAVLSVGRTTGRGGLRAWRRDRRDGTRPGGGDRTCQGPIGGPKLQDGRPRRCALTAQPPCITYADPPSPRKEREMNDMRTLVGLLLLVLASSTAAHARDIWDLTGNDGSAATRSEIARAPCRSTTWKASAASRTRTGSGSARSRTRPTRCWSTASRAASRPCRSRCRAPSSASTSSAREAASCRRTPSAPRAPRASSTSATRSARSRTPSTSASRTRSAGPPASRPSSTASASSTRLRHLALQQQRVPDHDPGRPEHVGPRRVLQRALLRLRRDPAGHVRAEPRSVRTAVLNTGTVPGVAGKSGSIIVNNDGRYGVLTGKAVALEPPRASRSTR